MVLEPQEVAALVQQAKYGLFGALGAFANYFYFAERQRAKGKRFFSMLGLVANVFVGWWFGLVCGSVLPDSQHKTGLVMLAGFYLHPILATVEILVIEKVSKHFGMTPPTIDKSRAARNNGE